MTDLVKAQSPIVLYGSSLTPPERSKHRAWIGVRIEATLDGYWQNRPSDVVKAEILMDWMDGLEAFTPDEIRNACREWLHSSPRKKPNIGDIRQIILGKRQSAVRLAPKEPEPERDVVTAEEASAILNEFGFKPKRMKETA